MSDDREILEKAIKWQAAGEQVALATVVSTWGSSPRPVGSHMVIRADGVFFGSVSGGCVENAVVTGALAAIDADRPAVLEFGVSAWRNGLSCGGKIAVLVHRLYDVTPLYRVMEAHAQGRVATLGFRVADGALVADASPHEGVFIRIYRPSPRLVIAGAVHIAESLARMAEMTGFQTLVFDPRREFARRGTFDRDPVIGWPDAVFHDYPLDARTAVVSLTHAPKVDHPTMVSALRSPAFYIGALGSRPTHAKRLVRLEGEGFSPEQLKRIHGPVGLPIGASSPAEIAVSILAELVGAWRRLDASVRNDAFGVTAKAS